MTKGRKYVQLAHGRIQFRSQKESLKIRNETALIQWIVDNAPELGGYIERPVVETLDKQVVKILLDKYTIVDSNGERVMIGEIPGVEFVPADETMKVDTGVKFGKPEEG